MHGCGFRFLLRFVGRPVGSDGVERRVRSRWLGFGVDRGWMHADLTLDTLDAPNFATRGTYGRVSLLASREELGASDNYTRLEGQLYRPKHRRPD